MTLSRLYTLWIDDFYTIAVGIEMKKSGFWETMRFGLGMGGG